MVESVLDLPSNILFGRSPNGSTGGAVAVKYLDLNFGPNSISARKAGNNYQMLLFDGHSSLVNARFLDYRPDNKIIPVSLRSHTTHRLQPLDVSIFSSYKHFYPEHLLQQWRNRQWSVSNDTLYVRTRSCSTTESISNSEYI